MLPQCNPHHPAETWRADWFRSYGGGTQPQTGGALLGKRSVLRRPEWNGAEGPEDGLKSVCQTRVRPGAVLLFSQV